MFLNKLFRQNKILVKFQRGFFKNNVLFSFVRIIIFAEKVT